MGFIQSFDEQLVKFTKTLTTDFIQTRTGQLFLNLSMVGPFTFVPTAWAAWFAPNIDVLRTPTWPMMVVINLSVLVGVCHNGDWRVRLSLVMWIILMLLVSLATLLR